jgi:hypothetical protein
MKALFVFITIVFRNEHNYRVPAIGLQALPETETQKKAEILFLRIHLSFSGNSSKNKHILKQKMIPVYIPILY